MPSFTALIGHGKIAFAQKASPSFAGKNVGLTLTNNPQSTATWVIQTNCASFNGLSTTHANATGPSRAVAAGDVIEFAAGTHILDVFTDVRGAAGDPVIIRGPATGRAIIRKTVQTTASPLTFNGCRYVTFDGESQTTALDPDGKRRNIRVMYSSNAGSTVATRDQATFWIKFGGGSSMAGTTWPTYTQTRDITIRYIEIDGGWTNSAASLSRLDAGGIAIGSNGTFKAANFGWGPTAGANAQYQEGLIYEHNYIHNCRGEGTYTGSNPSLANGAGADVPLAKCKIRYNYLVDIGGNGIECKSWFGGSPGADGANANSIHGNVLIRCGVDNDSVNVNGRPSISCISSKANIFNNWIEAGGGRGINYFIDAGTGVNLPNEVFVVDIYNNIVRGCNQGGQSGVDAGDGGNGLVAVVGADAAADGVTVTAKIYCNTVVSNAGGISGQSITASSFAKNNLVIGNGGTAVSGITNTNNNTTGTLAGTFIDPTGTPGFTWNAAGYWDVSGVNLELLAHDAALGSIGADIPANDFKLVTRPQNALPDKGAYEQ